MLVSNKHFIPVVGLDIHIVILFGFPIPLPHPYIGFVLDPMDYVPFIGATTKINHVPRGKSDTSGIIIILFHIPMGGPFLLAPMIAHDSVNFFGSKKVKVEGNLMSPSGHMLMTCNDIGIPLSLQPGKKMKPIPSMYLPTSFSIPLSFGKPVMVGGPFVPDWAGVLLNLIMSYGFGALMKGLGSIGKKMLTKFNHALKGKLGSNKLSKLLCKKGFEPVDLVQGIVIYDGVDFELPGPIPIKWERSWNSDSTFNGVLGHGNHLCYDMRLQEFPAATVVLLGDGRSAVFDPLPYSGDSEYNRHEKLLLTRTDIDEYVLFDYNSRLAYTFRQLRLISIVDQAGFMISFHYKGNGHLLRIIDSAGRHLHIQNDKAGRITQVSAEHRGEKRLLVSYAYNESGDLAEITDALDKTTYIQYSEHLMVKKTDRNGQSFYWEYDKAKRCIHTYGDGGLMEGFIEYHPKNGFNLITNSQGHTTTLYYNPDFVVTQIKAPLGNSTFFEYTDDMEIYRVIDAEGNVTGYTYDDLGNRTTVALPDGSVINADYDAAGRQILTTDPTGSSRTYIYYKKTGLLHTVTEADGRITIYRYNDKNLISRIEDEGENQTLLGYDEDFNLSSITLPDGATTNWKYDTWGQCLQRRNPMGETQLFQYDSLGRVTDIKLPRNHIKLHYNAYKDIIAAQDKLHEVRFEYTPMGNIKGREEKGIKTHFVYNNDQELTGIVNEQGEMYRFTRNANGDIISEKGFDGITRFYDLDSTGRVIKVFRPGNKWTAYEYNYNGLTTRIEHSDGTWEAFSYDHRGKLLEVTTPDNTVQFVRDALGRIIRESQNGHIVTSTYDRDGRRTAVQSSLGAAIQNRWNATGDLSGVNAGSWQAEIKRNLLGLEVTRTLPGDIISNWIYHTGSSAPDMHTLTGSVSRQYQWDADMRLKKITGEGVTRFGHDDIGNLAWAQYEDGQYDYRKLPETEKRYDEEGNLVKKIVANGLSWEYEWYGNGLLKQVRRPDQKTVSFQYDGLGRRTKKTFNGVVTRFVWDGHTPLHEWTYPEKEQPSTIVDEYGEISSSHPEPVPPSTLTTWIFEEKTFKLAAKITDQQQYSVITDHLGTPFEAYDAAGQKVWHAELDITGNVRKLSGLKDFVPFRYQGQYEDIETGLHYNRFRYYSPQEGMYISQDPIGFAGGWNTYAYVKDTTRYIDIWGWEDIWFRALHPNDGPNLDAGNGIVPKTPGATETPMSHVLNGSQPGYGDQYVSLTKDRRFAERWARDASTEVGEIDLDKLNNTKLDLSTAEGRLQHLGDVSRAPVGSDLHRANKYARGAKEMLIEGTVPNEAVVHRYHPPCL
jgi:RHS repeat-associated protein